MTPQERTNLEAMAEKKPSWGVIIPAVLVFATLCFCFGGVVVGIWNFFFGLEIAHTPLTWAGASWFILIPMVLIRVAWEIREGK